MLNSFPERECPDLSEAQARRLARMGVARPFRLVDTLIQQLSEPDGHEWFRRALYGPPFTTRTPGASDWRLLGAYSLMTGSATVEQLIALKEVSKAQARAEDRGLRLAARVGYALAIGAALAHHKTLITSQLRADLVLGLTDLAGALPEPWSGLMHDACEALAGMKEA